MPSHKKKFFDSKKNKNSINFRINIEFGRLVVKKTLVIVKRINNN